MSLRLVFLGTGGSWPSKEAGVSALALRAPKQTLLFDCGEGTQRQLMFSSVSFMSITHIFITHFHGDHFLGLPGLIQSMSLNDRKKELVIVGPEGIEDLTKTLLGLGYFTLTFPIKVITAVPGEGVTAGEGEDGGLTITPFNVEHCVPGIGYAVEEPMRPGKFDKARALELGVPEGRLFSKLQKGEEVEVEGKKITPGMVMGPPRPGRKVIITGDTKYLDPPPEIWRNCDALVHEATFTKELEERAGEYGHSTAEQAAKSAKKVGAGILFLVHRSPRYKDPAILEEEAKAVFPNSYFPKDLEETDIPLRD